MLHYVIVKLEFLATMIQDSLRHSPYSDSLVYVFSYILNYCNTRDFMKNNNNQIIPTTVQNYKKTFFRLISCLIILGLSIQSANASFYQSKNKSNNTTTYISVGQANVKANELVYGQPSGGYPVDYKLSQLIWETNMAKVLVAGLTSSDRKNYTLNVEGKFRLADGKGVMDDYDWLDIGNDWSHWSHHEDTTLTKLNGYDINLDINLYGQQQTKLSFIIGYKKESWAWEGRGGTYIYSSSGILRDLTGTFTDGELVISYEQHFAMPYLGLKFETTLSDWKVNLQYNYSNQVKVSATDFHHLRNLIFEDNFETGEMNSFKAAIEYKFSKNFGVYYRYDVQVFAEVRGNTTYFDSGTGLAIGACFNCAGADNSNQTQSIGISYTY